MSNALCIVHHIKHAYHTCKSPLRTLHYVLLVHYSSANQLCVTSKMPSVLTVLKGALLGCEKAAVIFAVPVKHQPEEAGNRQIECFHAGASDQAELLQKRRQK